MDVSRFEDFIITGSKTAAPPYANFLRGLLPTPRVDIVFTHGDVRSSNIMVDVGDHGEWRVVAVMDWVAAGFYLEY